MDTQRMSRDAASQDVLIGYGAGNSIAIIDLGQEIAFRATTYLNKLLSIIAATARCRELYWIVVALRLTNVFQGQQR